MSRSVVEYTRRRPDDDPLRERIQVDDCTRECVAIEVGRSIPGARVVRVFEQLRLSRGLPRVLVMNNGPEFTSRALDQ